MPLAVGCGGTGRRPAAVVVEDKAAASHAAAGAEHRRVPRAAPRHRAGPIAGARADAADTSQLSVCFACSLCLLRVPGCLSCPSLLIQRAKNHHLTFTLFVLNFASFSVGSPGMVDMFD